MKWLNGWTAALGALGVAALWNSRRPGEMTERRDAIYRKCLRGEVSVEDMRAIANAFEKTRCYPQACMLRKRIALKELPPEGQERMREHFEKGMASKNGPGVLYLAQTFDDCGATRSAAKLRRHAQALAKAAAPVAEPIVTPEAPSEPPSSEPPSERTDPTEPAIPIPGPPKVPDTLNGASHHVAISHAAAIS